MTIKDLYPVINPSFMADFRNSQVVDPRISVARASSATYTDQLGFQKEAATNQARISFDPVTGECLGLLIEEQRTNDIRNPRADGGTTGTITANTAGNGGQPTNWLRLASLTGITMEGLGIVTAHGMTGFRYRFYGTQTAGTFTTFEFESRSNLPASAGVTRVGSAYMRVVSSTVSLPSMTRLGLVMLGLTSGNATVVNNIFRTDLRSVLAVGATVPIRVETTALFTADLNAGNPVAQSSFGFEIGWTSNSWDITLDVFWPQCEIGAYSTTAMLPPVSAPAAATRAADVLTITPISDQVNTAQGTWIVEASTRGTGTQPVVSMDDNTANEQMDLYTQGTDPKFTVTDGGVTQADLDLGTVTALTPFKMGATYALNDFSACVNGGTVQTDVSGTVPLVDRIRIGSDQAGNQLVGYVNKVAYYPEAVTDAQLQALTS